MQSIAFETLADPTRRAIVEALRSGEQPVNAIVEQLDIHQSGVSRHLRILNDAGFVQVRPEGPNRYYSLKAERFVELDAWLSQYRALWESRLDRFGEELKRRQKARSKLKESRR